jgi:hypothetical protein
MLMTKVKLAAAVVLALATVGMGVGFYGGRQGTIEVAAAQTVPANNTAPAPAPPQKKDDLQSLQDKIDKLQKQLEEARRAEALLRERLEEQLVRTEVALRKAEVERQRAIEALAKAKDQVSRDLVLPGKLKVRLTEKGDVSVKARLPIELVFTNDAPEEGRFASGELHLCLLDKNGERVTQGLIVQDPEKKVFRVLGGKGQTTVLTPHVMLDAKVLAGEEYFLVVIIGNQSGMVRFTTK